VTSNDPNPWLDRPCFIWAHQGGAKEGPSNTLHAMREALANGADGIELDVHRTRDGKLVVCHDRKLDRTTNLSGRIASLELKEVQSADAAYWWVPGKVADHRRRTPARDHVFRGCGPANTDFRIPTLDEVLRAFPGVPLNLELKDEGYERELAAALRDDPAGPRSVIVASFSNRRLRRFRMLAPEARTAVGTWFLVSFWLLSRFGWGRTPPPGVVALQIKDRWWKLRIADQRFLDAAHRQGLAVHAWTVDGSADQDRLLELQVDGIMTDLPRALARRAGRVARPAEEAASESCDEAPSSAQAPPAVNELRVHGVGGSPGPRLLGYDDPHEAPIHEQIGRITIRRRATAEGCIEGFDWGGLTSGSMMQSLWAFLLPFTLVNVAGWAHAARSDKPARVFTAITHFLVVVVGAILTITWVLWLADLVVNYVAYQWVPIVFGTEVDFIETLKSV